MLVRKWEQHKTSKWVRSPYVSAYAYAYVGGVLTCYAYVMLMRLWEPAFTVQIRDAMPLELNFSRHNFLRHEPCLRVSRYIHNNKRFPAKILPRP